jgi:hypothetical protein
MIVYYLLYGFVALLIGSAVVRLVLAVLTALYLQRLATRGPGAVPVLGWIVFVLSYLTFRRQEPGPTSIVEGAAVGSVVGGAVGSIAAQQAHDYLIARGYPNNQPPGTLAGRISNGNRMS